MSQFQKILILGASVRSVMPSCYAGGFDPVGIDLFCDVDSMKFGPVYQVDADKRDWEERFHLALKYEKNVIGWMYTGGIENEPELIERLSFRIPLLGCDAEAVRKVRDPFLLIEMLHENGFKNVTCNVCHVGEHDETEKRWLIKPFRSAGGLFIREYLMYSQLNALEMETYYLQSFEEGEVYSAICLADKCQVYIFGYTRQLDNMQQGVLSRFQYTGSIGPVSLPEIIECQIYEIAKLLANKFSLIGLYGIDFILNGEQIKILEVNPRYPASTEIIEHCSGQTVVSKHIQACFGQLVSNLMKRPSDQPSVSAHLMGLTGHRPRFCAKQIIYAEADLKVPAIWDWDIGFGNMKSVLGQAILRDLPSPKTFIKKGDPVLTLIQQANEIETCEIELKKRADALIEAIHDCWAVEI